MSKQEEWRIKVAEFEGPLDLLLHLIKEMKVDIYEIPMIAITDQYLAYLHSMSVLQLDVAGEYLVMAATLLEIKSRMLLPQTETAADEWDDAADEEDLQAQLIEQLVAYKQFKEASQVLKEREAERGQFFAKPASDLTAYQQQVPLPEGEVSTGDLIHAFERMLQRLKHQQPMQATIENEKISVEDTMRAIEQRLAQCRLKEGVAFSSLFVGSSKAQLIATFLAVLELAKARKLHFEQQSLYEEIYVFNVAQHDQTS